MRHMEMNDGKQADIRNNADDYDCIRIKLMSLHLLEDDAFSRTDSPGSVNSCGSFHHDFQNLPVFKHWWNGVRMTLIIWSNESFALRIAARVVVIVLSDFDMCKNCSLSVLEGIRCNCVHSGSCMLDNDNTYNALHNRR